MKRLILTRHGQTEWNIERRYQGQMDTELTVFGREQMVGTAEALRVEQVRNNPNKFRCGKSGILIDRLVTSPLKRARESAEIVAAGLELEVQVDERLIEMDLGAWTGKSYSLGRNGDEWFESAPHGGETGAQFRGRIQSWLDENLYARTHFDKLSAPLDAKSNDDETVLLVVHGLVVQVILSILLEEDFEVWHRRPIKNGSVTILSKQDWGWRLESFNK